MKNRKLPVFLSAVIALSLLCGCASVNVNVKPKDSDDTKQEDTAPADTDTKAADDNTDEASDGSADDAVNNDFPQLVSTDFDLSKYDGDTMYFECKGNTWALTDESAAKYPELSQQVDNVFEDMLANVNETLRNNDEEAKQFAKDNSGDENFFCYALDEDTLLACADANVVSLVTTQFMSLGGAHPTTGTFTCNLDVTTGEVIPLAKLISDKEGLDAMIKEILIEQYTDHAFFGLDESLAELSMDPYSADPGTLSYVYSFAPDGLTFYFDPAFLSPYADGGEQVYLSFDQLSPVLNKDEFVTAE